MHCCIAKTKYPAQPCLKTRNRLTKHCQTCLIHSIPLVQFQTNRLCEYELSLYHNGIFGTTVLVFWKCCQQALWHLIASKLHPSKSHYFLTKHTPLFLQKVVPTKVNWICRQCHLAFAWRNHFLFLMLCRYEEIFYLLWYFSVLGDIDFDIKLACFTTIANS